MKYKKILKLHISYFSSKLNKLSNSCLYEDHYPVLWREIIDIIDQNVYNDHEKDKYKLFGDFTLGCGNHTKLILDSFPKSHVIGVDIDPNMIEYNRIKLSKYLNDKRLILVNDNYTSIRDIDINQIFYEKRIFKNDKKFDFIMADLGFNSLQLKDPKKGMSFNLKESELDMRYDIDDNNRAKANEILNNCSELELAEIFKNYGEEKHYEPLVRNIIIQRETKRFHSVDDFLKIIDQTFKLKSIDIYNTYTRLFQALRIAVNYELFNIKRFLNKCFSCMENNGIIAIITFHSLEDNIVVRFFKELHKLNYGKIINNNGKKPTKNELIENSRSHSATLRLFLYKI